MVYMLWKRFKVNCNTKRLMRIKGNLTEDYYA